MPFSRYTFGVQWHIVLDGGVSKLSQNMQLQIAAKPSVLYYCLANTNEDWVISLYFGFRFHLFVVALTVV